MDTDAKVAVGLVAFLVLVAIICMGTIAYRTVKCDMAGGTYMESTCWEAASLRVLPLR